MQLRLSRTTAATVSVLLLTTAALAPQTFAAPKHKAHKKGSGNAPKSSKSGKSSRRSHSSGDDANLVHHALVRVSTAKLRSAPGKDSKATALLDAGRYAKVIERKDGWAKLRLDSGRTGWVRRDLLSVSKKAVVDHGVQPVAKKRVVAAKAAPKRHKTVVVVHVAPKPHKTIVAVKAAPKPHKTVVVAAAPALKKVIYTPVPAKSVPAKAIFSKPPVSAKKAEQIRLHELKVAAQQARHEQNVAAQKAKHEQNLRARAALHEQHVAEAALHAAQAKANANARHLARLANQQARARAKAERLAKQNAAALSAIERAKELREMRAADASDGETTTYTPTLAELKSERLVRSALAYRGTPYRFGATGNGAFDCSSFTQYLFGKQGEDLPRTAAEQYSHGKPVSKSDMQIGDLVFFKNTYKHGVSHVGVYIGNGHFVHASSGSHAVTVTSLSSAYYVNHWAGARRPR